MSSSTLKFVLDNQLKEINFQYSKYTPTTTLLQFLRSLPGHKGTKEGCAEGDCGACTVVLGQLRGQLMEYEAVDSCLILLPMIHGKQVITVENIGHSESLHPVQEALVKYNGSQCGYCSPGIIMSLFSYYKNEKCYNRELVQDYLVGNLCRCTGYQSIFSAAENIEFDQEDIIKIQEKNSITLLQSIQNDTSLKFSSGSQIYYKVFSLFDALELKDEFPEAELISGSTDISLKVTKKHQNIPLIIDISDVRELQEINKSQNQWQIGSGVNLNIVKDEICEDLPALSEILKVFGSRQIRNLASLGGNIGSASPIGDTIPVLMAYNADLVLESTKGDRKVPIREFITGYRKTKMQPNEIITKVMINIPGEQNRIKSYKISKRKDLDISTVSVGFSLVMNNESKVEDINLFYGGMAEKTAHAEKTENFLLNKHWTRENIENATRIMEKDFTPITDARSGNKARMIMAKNLLIKFWNDTKIDA